MEKNLTTDVARVFAAKYAEGKMSSDEYLDLLEYIFGNSTNSRLADNNLVHLSEVGFWPATETEGKDTQYKLEFNYEDVARDLAAQYADYKLTTSEYLDLFQTITEKNSLV